MLHLNIRSLFIVAVSFIFFNSCTFTPMLHKKRPYVEEVTSILLSENNEKIIVISPKYHYIFDAPPIIVESINSSYASKVKADFKRFRVDSKNSISGQVFLDITNGTESEILSASRAGYRTNGYARVRISGVRYAANGDIVGAKAYQLKQKYEIQVIEPISPLGKTVRAALTPIALAADGVLVMGGLVLVPFVFTVVGFLLDP